MNKTTTRLGLELTLTGKEPALSFIELIGFISVLSGGSRYIETMGLALVCKTIYPGHSDFSDKSYPTSNVLMQTKCKGNFQKHQ